MTYVTVEREDGTEYTKHGVPLGLIERARTAAIEQAKVVVALYMGDLADHCTPEVVLLKKALDQLDGLISEDSKC